LSRCGGLWKLVGFTKSGLKNSSGVIYDITSRYSFALPWFTSIGCNLQYLSYLFNEF